MIKYPDKKEMPSRKQRKAERNKIFILNRKESKLRKERRGAKRNEEVEEEQF